MKSYWLLRMVTGIICVYCLILGLCLNSSETVIQGLAVRLLDYELQEEPVLILAARLIGVYMAFFGMTMGLVAWRPVQNRALLSVASGFLVVRVLQRSLYFNDLQNTFGLTAQKNSLYLGSLFVIALLLLVLRMRIWKDMRETSVSPEGSR